MSSRMSIFWDKFIQYNNWACAHSLEKWLNVNGLVGIHGTANTHRLTVSAHYDTPAHWNYFRTRNSLEFRFCHSTTSRRRRESQKVDFLFAVIAIIRFLWESLET